MERRLPELVKECTCTTCDDPQHAKMTSIRVLCIIAIKMKSQCISYSKSADDCDQKKKYCKCTYWIVN